MKKYKILILLCVIFAGLSTSVDVNASNMMENKFMDVTAQVDFSDKIVHVPFKKFVPEDLKDVTADIEVINNKNGEIAHFDDVTIGKDGSITDDTVITFNGSLYKEFFSPPLTTSGENGNSLSNGSKNDSDKGILPQTGEEWNIALISVGVILFLGTTVFLITRRRKRAGEYLFVIIFVVGSVGFSGTASAVNRGFDFFQHESLQDGIYTINVDINANLVNNPTMPEEDQSGLEVKDSELIVGDVWTGEDNFISGTNKDGSELSFSEIIVEGSVDTTKAGTYKVIYKNRNIEKIATIKVKEDQSRLEVKDSELIVGDIWTGEDNFVIGTDKNGNEVAFSEITVEGSVDTTKVGIYKVIYKNRNIEKIATIKVKEDQSRLEVKDSELMVGDIWTGEDNFVIGTDKNGNEISFSSITVEGSVDTTKCDTYKIDYIYGNIKKTATVKVVKGPNAPTMNEDGSISFSGQNWDVIKDYNDGTKMIAMQNKIATSKFNLQYFFNTNDDNLDGYQDSIIKPIVDDWYNQTINGTIYENFVQPVTLSNPTLATMKGLGWSSNINGSLDKNLWNSEINEPSKYPTVVGNGEKQAFLMSGSDVTIDANGNLSQAVLMHKKNLSNNGTKLSWLRSPGYGYSSATSLYAGGYSGVYFYFQVMSHFDVVPSLVVYVPS